MTRHRKFLSIEEQIQHLSSKGVSFQLISIDDAKDYLDKHNNYFRLRSYRKCFAKVEGGQRNGQYIGLDFAMLIDMSIIDMRLRFELLPMTIDIEHFSKVKLLSRLEQSGEDGYQVVQDFLKLSDTTDKDGNQTNLILEEIRRGLNGPYTKDLVNSAPAGDYPVWAFVELISFGCFNEFYRFCANRLQDRRMLNEYYLLQSVRGLRNACAHNNCIINDMKAHPDCKRANNTILRELSSSGIRGKTRQTKMRNERFKQIATTLYLHQKLSTAGVRDSRGKSLRCLSDRMDKHADYYVKNDIVRTGFAFIKKMIEGWYPAFTDDNGKADLNNRLKRHNSLAKWARKRRRYDLFR